VFSPGEKARGGEWRVRKVKKESKSNIGYLIKSQPIKALFYV
jgi:hypothetical protein